MIEPGTGDKPPDARDQAMDALVAASRVHRGSAMDGEYVELSNPEVGRIRKRAQQFLAEQEELPRAQRVTRGKLADAIGESKSTVSQVLSCKYPKGKQDGWRRRDEVLRKLDKYLSLQEARRDSPRRAGFAWTKVAEDIKAVADATVRLETIGAIWCPAGCGKTMTLQALLDVFPGSVLITIDDAVHSPTTLLRELCDRLKLGSFQHRQSLMRAICTGLRESKRLVMVDESHLTTPDTLGTVKAIHDKTECPVLLAGMPALGRMLLRGRGDDSKGATLYSRIGVVRDLTERCRQGGDRGEPLFSTQDVKRVFARSTLRIDPDATAWLQALACMPEVGGLRSCNNAVRLAGHIAQQRGEQVISVKLLTAASRLLLGVERAKQIGNRIAQRAKVA